MQKRQKSAGFTLISSSIALAVIASFMAFVIPQVSAVHDAYALGALQDQLKAWAQIAQDSGMTLARFEKCDASIGETCTYKKFGLYSDCHGKWDFGAEHHYYADGHCFYNLKKPGQRNRLENHGYKLPDFANDESYTNTQNGKPIFLLHQDKQVQAFTCVDKDFVVENGVTQYAEIVPGGIYKKGACNGNDHYALYYAMPDIPRSRNMALARRMQLGDGDIPNMAGGGSVGGYDR